MCNVWVCKIKELTLPIILYRLIINQPECMTVDRLVYAVSGLPVKYRSLPTKVDTHTSYYMYVLKFHQDAKLKFAFESEYLEMCETYNF